MIKDNIINKKNTYNPLNDPNSMINFLIRDRELMKVKGLQDTKEYADLERVIQETIRQYKQS